MANPKNRFVYHKPTNDMINLMEQVRQRCSDLDDLLLAVPSHPRYTALARTALETVSMYANKGIVFVDERD